MLTTSTMPHVLLNLAAAVLLATALGFGIFLNHNVVLVWDREGCGVVLGVSLVDLERYFDRNIWNFMFGCGGSLFGALVYVSFAVHERYLHDVTRRRGLRGEPQLPFLVRPMTRAPRPTVDDKAPFRLGGSSLMKLSLFSALTCVASLATFGMNNVPFSVSSPMPKLLTRDISAWTYQPVNRELPQVSSSDMMPLVYRSAYMRTLDKIQGDKLRRPQSTLYRVDSPPLRVGQGWFPDLRTRGIGAHEAPFTPRTYPWSMLTKGWTVTSFSGVVIGTNITATCKKSTDESNWKWTHSVVPSDAAARKMGFQYRFEVAGTVPGYRDGLTVFIPENAEIGMKTWQDVLRDSESKILRQTFVIARLVRATQGADPENPYNRVVPQLVVIECLYLGSDVPHFIALNEPTAPVEFLKELEPVAQLAFEDMQPAATAVNLALGRDGLEAGARGGDGGALMDGLEHAGIQTYLRDLHKAKRDDIDMVRLLEDILTDATQGYFTLRRQGAEGYSGPYDKDWSGGELTGRALRVGGGGWLWVGIIGLLTAMPIVALTRIVLLACLVPAWDANNISPLLLDDDLNDDEQRYIERRRLGLEDDDLPPYQDEEYPNGS
ncbi:hypothetical protein GQ53DRAFT_32936 [Thozetella sp. PMI_491]|nr:hypothetical protein GQ53DRAFT_32936 [Thozetella sp. PMI_491]